MKADATTNSNSVAPILRHPPVGMRHVPTAQFMMGSDHHYPEEAPARSVTVDGFWIDETPVTNREFARFVDETGYKSFAETAPDPKDYPGMPPELAKAGSLLFTPTSGPVPLHDFSRWWSFSFGTNWRHPLGPTSDLSGLEDHPVVHIALIDAEAYASWAGKAIPTEAEWELAARGGLHGLDYAWGTDLNPDGRMMANYWQGQFPYQNLALDGFHGTSPVKSFASNDYGLYDMIGNIWEWTCDWYAQPSTEKKSTASCCIPRNPRGAEKSQSYDPCTPHIPIGRKVLKGGSFLCAENYCQRYRPAARHAQAIDSSASHVGFRCVIRGESDG